MNKLIHTLCFFRERLPIIIFIICLFLAFSACSNKSNSPKNGSVQPSSNSGEQLSSFVRRIIQDKSGNLWFGTNGDGVIPIENSGVYRYDGKSFTNFQKNQGLTSNAIQSIFEDKQGRLWLGGWMGLFRYDGKSIFGVGKDGPWQ